jgi:hypothetical protein
MDVINHDFNRPSQLEIETELLSLVGKTRANDSRIGKLTRQLELVKTGWQAGFTVLWQNGIRVAGSHVTFKSKFCNRKENKWVIQDKWFQAYRKQDQETPRRWNNFLALGFEWREELLPAHIAQVDTHCFGAPLLSVIVPDDTSLIVTYS